MRVLVVEGSPGAAATARATLTEAGHEVTACHNGGPVFPCHGLGGGPGCPLERGGGVDVVMLVRDQPGSQPTVTEDGVRCALRRHVPLAVAGIVDDNPYSEFAAAIAPGFDDVLDAVERAARSPLAAHTGVARAALRTVLDREGIDAPDADVSVLRHGPTLTVVLQPGIDLDPMVLETASVRVLGAVRALDRNASIIDVTVASPSTTSS
jgi:hypothetical protein